MSKKKTKHLFTLETFNPTSSSPSVLLKINSADDIPFNILFECGAFRKADDTNLNDIFSFKINQVSCILPSSSDICSSGKINKALKNNQDICVFTEEKTYNKLFDIYNTRKNKNDFKNFENSSWSISCNKLIKIHKYIEIMTIKPNTSSCIWCVRIFDKTKNKYISFVYIYDLNVLYENTHIPDIITSEDTYVIIGKSLIKQKGDFDLLKSSLINFKSIKSLFITYGDLKDKEYLKTNLEYLLIDTTVISCLENTEYSFSKNMYMSSSSTKGINTANVISQQTNLIKIAQKRKNRKKHKNIKRILSKENTYISYRVMFFIPPPGFFKTLLKNSHKIV